MDLSISLVLYIYTLQLNAFFDAEGVPTLSENPIQTVSSAVST